VAGSPVSIFVLRFSVSMSSSTSPLPGLVLWMVGYLLSYSLCHKVSAAPACTKFSVRR
jgi:hypothetical protein